MRRREQRAHARGQFVEIERFDQVVVGARIEAANPLVDRVARGQDDDRCVAAVLAIGIEHLDTVFLRQAEIEQHEVVHAVSERQLRRAAVLGPVDRIAGAAHRAQHRLRNHVVVFDQ